MLLLCKEKEMEKELNNIYKELKEQNKALQRITKALESLEKHICHPIDMEWVDNPDGTMTFRPKESPTQ